MQKQPSYYNESDTNPGNELKEAAKLKLREEKLDIVKKWVQTGKVSIRRETIQEVKTISVPISREELVIEKKTMTGDVSSPAEGGSKILRIPISEEQIEIIKKNVELADISVYKREFLEVRHIKKNIRKEELRIDGDASQIT